MDRPANDIESEARVVHEVYIIDPSTKKPGMPGGSGGPDVNITQVGGVDVEGGALPITGTISAETSAVASASAPTYDEGTEQALSQTLGGRLRVEATASGSFPVTGTFWQATQPISGTVSVTGVATAANQTATTGSKAAGTAAASSVLTGGVFNTSLPTLTNGQQAALQFDSSARLYVTVGASALPTGAATAANQSTANTALGAPSDTAWSSGDGSHTALLKAIAGEALSTDPVNVTKSKSSPYFNGNVGSTKYLVATGAQVLTDYFIENPDTSNKAYVQFFNAASTGAVTLGTTTPVRSIGLAAGEKTNLADLALDFSSGIVIAGTTTATGSTTATTGLVVNLGYKAG